MHTHEQQARSQLIVPPVTQEEIEAAVIAEDFHHFPGTRVTACLLTMRNGHHVAGLSFSSALADFDAEKGKRLAREDAKATALGLLRYEKREREYRHNLALLKAMDSKGGAA